MSALELLAHALALLLLPPLLLGVIARTKALAAGRRGAPLLQPWYDVVKLLRKDRIQSRTTTWVFLAGPAVAVATATLAALLVPFGEAGAPLSFQGDLVLYAYLFGLGRFFTIAAALDTGSSFEGMGAAREATFSALAEPALFLALLVLVSVRGDLSLSGLGDHSTGALWATAAAPAALACVGLFIVLLAENSRIPFDDPTTHLELTMVHEVMVLDHSGPDLAMILYANALKLALFAGIIVNVVLPQPRAGGWLGIAVLLGSVIAVGIAVGIVESVMARLRLPKVPLYIAASSALALFGLVLLLR
jgi:formate hydrogenlyase subunit 4